MPMPAEPEIVTENVSFGNFSRSSRISSAAVSGMREKWRRYTEYSIVSFSPRTTHLSVVEPMSSP